MKERKVLTMEHVMDKTLDFVQLPVDYWGKQRKCLKCRKYITSDLIALGSNYCSKCNDDLQPS